MTKASMAIDYLAAVPGLLDELAPLLHREWGHHNNEKSVADRVTFMKPRLTLGGVPTCFVAHENGSVMGTVSLIADDFTLRPQYTPWLATLYVMPQFRKRGVGARLMERVESEARQIGVTVLYLTTNGSEPYYERHGWSVVERAENHGRIASIMSKRLAG